MHGRFITVLPSLLPCMFVVQSKSFTLSGRSWWYTIEQWENGKRSELLAYTMHGYEYCLKTSTYKVTQTSLIWITCAKCKLAITTMKITKPLHQSAVPALQMPSSTRINHAPIPSKRISITLTRRQVNSNHSNASRYTYPAAELNAQVFFPRQALNSIRPSPRWMITAVVWRHYSLCPWIPYHPQNLSHCRSVLWCNRNTSHCNIKKRLKFLLWCLIARADRFISWLCLLLANWTHPSWNVWAMFLNKVLEGSLSG